MITNMLKHFPDAALKAEAETFEELISQPGVLIERIVSTGQSSPEGFWYCQPQSEWVVVLQGSAGVRFENEAEMRVMHVGDFINIPAQCRHRVEWTDPHGPTVWLAVHYGLETTEKNP
ncbi:MULTISPECIES: cupin domain-containing protein [unclassified Serratia (in: enterobacteria)]|uniref:cupin domain-containing protein n=1 Tax=unclassified Serratia (in: enterobacteria) TaxID=2647522 RepID=UPI00050451EA|nr:MULTISPECIES: cupin domain-containing protein [unclassified Serratia (in: enterobacteria)]KFK94657.1 cupin [Serratia sp. Ag2]KFK99183.1 cupin [Serratia sp. Ag1]